MSITGRVGRALENPNLIPSRRWPVYMIMCELYTYNDKP